MGARGLRGLWGLGEWESSAAEGPFWPCAYFAGWHGQHTIMASADCMQLMHKHPCGSCSSRMSCHACVCFQ